jgi:hypothetical protein
MISIATAATLTTNTHGDHEACQGETWTLTCTGRSHIHRWTLETEGSETTDAIMMTYIQPVMCQELFLRDRTILHWYQHLTVGLNQSFQQYLQRH